MGIKHRCKLPIWFTRFLKTGTSRTCEICGQEWRWNRGARQWLRVWKPEPKKYPKKPREPWRNMDA